MRVTPGQQIPFWLKIFDGNPSVYVVAHVTNLSGVEQVDSPVTLTYSGNRGIYTGLGPICGTNNLRVDYEVFSDSGLTQASRKYLPSYEDVEADISTASALATILGVLSNVNPSTVLGTVEVSTQLGTLDTQVITGNVILTTTQGMFVTGEINEGEIQNVTIQGNEDY